MRETSRFTVRGLPVEPGDGPLCDLLDGGAPVGLSVAGAVLEAAYEGDGFFLLFMTDDVPQEEGLSIHLVSPDFKDLETAALVRVYGSGTFRNAVILGPRQIGFTFFDEVPVLLQVLDRPEWRMPFMGEYRGLMRPFSFTRRFRVGAMPPL